MIRSQDPFLRPFLNIVFGMYLLVGLAGAILVSDEFDQMRFWLFTYVGLPVTTGFYFFSYYLPSWSERYTTVYRAAIVAQLLVFGIGVLTLLNAAGGQSSTVMQNAAIHRQHFQFSMHRGTFGYNYRYRF